MNSKFVKWTSIEQLHHVYSELIDGQRDMPRIGYRAKIKLDGTHAAIRIMPDCSLYAQSRTRIIFPADDNYGFADWVNSLVKFRESLILRRTQERANSIFWNHMPLGSATIFGEWCGSGIQGRTAVSKIPRKIFAVFAIQFGDSQSPDAIIVTNPETIEFMMPFHEDIFVLPWASELIECDYAEKSSIQDAAARINELVESVEGCDPWVYEKFGIEGLGEGVVMYPTTGIPTNSGQLARKGYGDLIFKAKGEKHEIVRQARPAQLAPETVASIDDFVAMVATTARLEQALDAVSNGRPKTEDIGPFIKWLSQDVLKECSVELIASGLNWKQVARPLSKFACDWLKNCLRESIGI